jgi:hypothetical protein
MKTFKNLLSEVAQPTSADEQRFKAKHEIEIINHPVAFEHQFTGAFDPDPRLADYIAGEDEEVYEEVQLDEWGFRVNNNGNTSKDIKKKFLDVKNAADDLEKTLRNLGEAVHGRNYQTVDDSRGKRDTDVKLLSLFIKQVKEISNSAEEGAIQAMKQSMGESAEFEVVAEAKREQGKEEKYAKATDKDDDGEGLDPVGKGDADIDNDGDSDSTDQYLKKRRAAISKTMKKNESAYDVKESMISKLLGRIGMSEAASKTDLENLEKEYDKQQKIMDVITDKGGNYKNSPAYKKSKDIWKKIQNAKKDLGEDAGAFITKAAAAKQKNKKKFTIGDDQYPVTIKDKNIKKIMDEENIDEISKKTLGSYVKKAYTSSDLKRTGAENVFDRADAASSSKLATDLNARGTKLSDKSRSRKAFADKAVDRLAKESLDEAFKVGSMEMKNGDKVKVSSQDAKLLNQMFDGLSDKNKKEMMKVATTDKSGFAEIVGFAREAI